MDGLGLAIIPRIQHGQRQSRPLRFLRDLQGAIATDDALMIAGAQQNPVAYFAEQLPGPRGSKIRQHNQPSIQIPV